MRKYTPVALIVGALALASLSLDIDWIAFTTALTGMLPTLTLLVAGVIASVVTIAVLFKAVPWLAHLVTRFMH